MQTMLRLIGAAILIAAIAVAFLWIADVSLGHAFSLHTQGTHAGSRPPRTTGIPCPAWFARKHLCTW